MSRTVVSNAGHPEGHAQTGAFSRLNAAGKNELPQRDGIIETHFSGREQQGHRAGPHGLDRMRQRGWLMLQFLQVALLEHFPFVGFVVEPLAKFRAGGEFLEPQVEAGFFPGESAQFKEEEGGPVEFLPQEVKDRGDVFAGPGPAPENLMRKFSLDRNDINCF